MFLQEPPGGQADLEAPGVSVPLALQRVRGSSVRVSHVTRAGLSQSCDQGWSEEGVADGAVMSSVRKLRCLFWTCGCRPGGVWTCLRRVPEEEQA